MALPLDKLNKLLRTAAFGVEVVQTATKGRGIVATRAHRAGAAVVPAGEPLAHSSKRAVNIALSGHGEFARYERAWRKARGKLEGADGRRHPLLVAQIASRVAHEPDASPYVLAGRGVVLGQDVGADAGALGRGLRGRQERARGRRQRIRVPHGRVVRTGVASRGI